MIRLPLFLTAAAAAAAAAVTPAIVGLTGNPSFSERLPVQVPVHANVATFPTRSVVSASPTREREPGDDRRNDRRGRGPRREDRRSVGPTATTLPSTVSREPEPGDDHRGGGHHGGDHHGSGHHGGNDE